MLLSLPLLSVLMLVVRINGHLMRDDRWWNSRGTRSSYDGRGNDGRSSNRGSGERVQKTCENDLETQCIDIL